MALGNLEVIGHDVELPAGHVKGGVLVDFHSKSSQADLTDWRKEGLKLTASEGTGRPAWAHLPFLCFLTTTYLPTLLTLLHCFYFTDNWQLRPHQPTVPSSCFHFCQGVDFKKVEFLNPWVVGHDEGARASTQGGATLRFATHAAFWSAQA